ncbi:hypothetical protein Tco_1112217 [Tanacetum coccineum]|uniref:No apical meristem-associated C-terminal domain-containing protein n=1 Tax=Tanacetum coccineum TaxID=301880 RepID=A0ABQ5IP52_9ASTR
MGGSSSQPHTEQSMSFIHAFPTEDMYSPQYSYSYQNNACEDYSVEVAAPPPKLNPTRRRQKRTTQNENAPWQTTLTNEEEIALCKGWAHVSENNSIVRKSGIGDEDYYARALLDYEAEHGMPFTLRHCWEVLKESGDASINLNVDVGDDEEDEVDGLRAGNEQQTCHWKEERRTLSLLEIKMREVECRERELAMQEYRQRQEDIRFYMQPYDHLTGDALNHMEALRAEIKAKWNLPY